jgi:Homeodomain-like domain
VQPLRLVGDARLKSCRWACRLTWQGGAVGTIGYRAWSARKTGAATQDGASVGAARAHHSAGRRWPDEHSHCWVAGVDLHRVGRWRQRFAGLSLDGLFDEPRPGAPRKIGDEEIAETIRRTLEARPAGATHWSLRSMAAVSGYAPSTIHRILRFKEALAHFSLLVHSEKRLPAVDRSSPLPPPVSQSRRLANGRADPMHPERHRLRCRPAARRAWAEGQNRKSHQPPTKSIGAFYC